jgi:hypothetical protein
LNFPLSWERAGERSNAREWKGFRIAEILKDVVARLISALASLNP